MLERLSTRERRLAVVTSAILAAAAIYRIVVFPQVSLAWELADRASAATVRIYEMDRALALSERIENEYEGYEAAIAQKGTDLEESSAFLRAVYGLTDADGMKRVRQDQLPIQLHGYHKLFSVRLGVQTRPAPLARFLSALESSDQLIRIEDIRITALDDTEALAVDMKLTKVIAAEGARQ